MSSRIPARWKTSLLLPVLTFVAPVLAQTRPAQKIVVNVAVSVVGKSAASSIPVPVFTPGAGAYVAGQQIVLTDTIPGATIYYTTDGSPPSTSSPVYKDPLVLLANEVIRAKAATVNVSSTTAAASFTVTPPHLVFNTQPGDTQANALLGPAPAVSIIDGNGALVQTASSPITLSLAANPGNANLTGTVTATTLHGVATFPNLSVTSGGIGYTLSATSPGIASSVSTVFNVLMPSITIALPGSSVAVGHTVAGVLTLGQAAVGQGVTLTLASSSAAMLNVSPATITIPAGQSTAAFTLTGLSPGPSTLTASTAAYSPATAEITTLPAAPIVTPTSGAYASGQQVTLTDIVPGASIHYTTDGSTPTSASPLYSAPITLTASQTISTIAVQGILSSAINSQAFQIANVKVALIPGSVTLSPSQTQSFTATVSGSVNNGVSWSLSPALGTISAAGFYTAPASINAAQVVTVTATSASDNTKTASATISLVPPISLSVTPGTASLFPSGTHTFLATVSGSTNTSVSWSVNPAVGTISAAGLYTAPSSITTSQVLTVIATSAADTTKSASASITLSPLPNLTLALPGTSASLGSTLTGTVSLSQPAATGGVVVSLSSSSTAFVTVLPATVTIPSGQSTASFTLVGIAAGASTLSAAATNYQPATIAVAVTSASSGTTYYVANSGLDTNNGTSSVTPWKTVAKVNAAHVKAGDQILFESNGIWHEELDIPAAGLRFGAYGALRNCALNAALVATCAHMPILDGADAVSGWVVQGGATYKAPFHAVASKGFVDSLYTQTKPLPLVSSVAAVQATAGTLYSDGNFVYIHLLDGSDPATHTIEISGSRMYGIYIGAYSNTTIDGLEIVRVAKSGILAYDQSAAADNVTIQNNVLFNNSDAGSDPTANPNGIVERSEGGIEMQSVYGQTMKNLVIQNNWVGQQDFADMTANFFQAGIFALSTTNAIVRNNKVATVHGAGIILGDGFASSNACTGPVIDGNELTNSEGNIQLSGCTAVQEINNSVHDSFGNCSEAGGGFHAGSTSSQGVWNNNDCHRIAAAYNNGLFNGFDNNPVINSTFSNNRISQVAAASISLETTGSVASTGNKLISNLIDSSQNTNYDSTAASNALSMYVQTGAAATLTMQGNAFIFGPGGFIRFGAAGPWNDGHDLSLTAFTQLYPQ